MRKITILGATGSVGMNTVDLININKNKYNVVAISGFNNYKLLSKIAIKLNSKYAVIGNKEHFNKLKELLKKTDITCLCGESGILKVATFKTDIIFSCIVGLAGLRPTLRAIKNTKIVALANKESIVGAGNIIMNESKKYNTIVIPLDSEHNALFRVLEKEKIKNIKDIIITASGGPFWNKNLQSFNKITIVDALNHPNWKMGKKITIDSATMMNKLLEIIEAAVLFNLDLRQIKIVIHPSSIIHGIINYVDGTSFLIASKPDMKIPINFALNWPEKEKASFESLNFPKIKNIQFFNIDKKKFPAVNFLNIFINKKFFYSKAIVLNAANEIAVESFLEGKISFLNIVKLIKKILYKYSHRQVKTVNDIISIDKEVRSISYQLIEGFRK